MVSQPQFSQAHVSQAHVSQAHVSQAQTEQQHPQQHLDRAIVEKLLQSEPTDYNLVELARLKIRYTGFPGAREIQTGLANALKRWQLTEEDLYQKTRSIHAQQQVYRRQSDDQEDWT